MTSRRESTRFKFFRYDSFHFKYSELPGILGERFFAIMDSNKDGYVDLKEFVHGMFKVYYSTLDSKMKLVFDMYPIY